MLIIVVVLSSALEKALELALGEVESVGKERAELVEVGAEVGTDVATVEVVAGEEVRDVRTDVTEERPLRRDVDAAISVAVDFEALPVAALMVGTLGRAEMVPVAASATEMEVDGALGAYGAFGWTGGIGMDKEKRRTRTECRVYGHENGQR
jgi:hypothetical protein